MRFLSATCYIVKDSEYDGLYLDGVGSFDRPTVTKCYNSEKKQIDPRKFMITFLLN